eukprot:snap_masked-scaffold_3-processed-gene-1.1-mRNA-1 protein AED:1.00 eAED:1.00 QI:0/0/0/0/1/1/2/0/114
MNLIAAKIIKGASDTIATKITDEHLTENVIESEGDIENPYQLWNKISELYVADENFERNRLYSQLINSPDKTAIDGVNKFDTNQKGYLDIEGRLNDKHNYTVLRTIKDPFVDNL